jgi:hypothetical protein
MSTLPDLMDAYRDLADHAPTIADMHLATPPTTPTRRGTTMRAVLATLIAVVAIAALVVYLRSHALTKHEPPAEVSQPRWPDSYTLGPDSLPGYTLTRTDTQTPRGRLAHAPPVASLRPQLRASGKPRCLSAVRPLPKAGQQGAESARGSSQEWRSSAREIPWTADQLLQSG